MDWTYGSMPRVLMEGRGVVMVVGGLVENGSENNVLLSGW